MKVRLLPIALIILFVALTIEAYSQSTPLDPEVKSKPIFIGPVAGYNKSMHTVDLASFADDPMCPYFTNGDGTCFYAGFSFEYMIGDPAKSTSSVIARVLYSCMPAYLEKTGDEYPSLVEDQSQPGGIAIVTSATKHSVDVKYSVISAEVMYKFNFTKDYPLGLTAGPTFDFPIQKTLLQKYEIIRPDNVQFQPQPGRKYENNYRTIIVQDGDIPNAAGFRLGLKFGVQYEIIPSQGMYIVPAVYYNFGLTKLTSAEDWRVNVIQVGVDVRFAL